MASQDGSWNVARHVELIADSKVRATSRAEMEAVVLREKHELQMRTLGKG